MDFKNLHRQQKPLLLANVWDVSSAKIAEELHFQAIGTSSSAISTLLGYNDGEEISFSELEYFVKKIIANTSLPLSVDLEAGYSKNPKEIAHHIKKLADLGVVGINIEDSIVENSRTLVNAKDFANLLSSIIQILKDEKIDIFINVRTDTFLLGVSNLIEDTINRIKLYENAGADGIFVPCIENVADIKKIVECTVLPINVMCMPNLPDFDSLNKLGVKRISMGNFIFDRMFKDFKVNMQKIQIQKSFSAIFS